jgi:hypothetical protein
LAATISENTTTSQLETTNSTQMQESQQNNSQPTVTVTSPRIRLPKSTVSEKEKRNWLIHLLYVRQDFKECLKVIEDQLKICKGLCEYAIYVKALIMRQQGNITESMNLFKACVAMNPKSSSNLKQVGRS